VRIKVRAAFVEGSAVIIVVTVELTVGELSVPSTAGREHHPAGSSLLRAILERRIHVVLGTFILMLKVPNVAAGEILFMVSDMGIRVLSEATLVPEQIVCLLFIVVVQVARTLSIVGREEAVAVTFICKHVDTGSDDGVSLASARNDGYAFAKVRSRAFHCMANVARCPRRALISSTLPAVCQASSEGGAPI